MSQRSVNSTASPHGSLPLILLTLLRIGVGWHFAYEGIAKLLNPQWSAAGYLQSANWVAADLFHSLAANPKWLFIVDKLNAWGLLLIGIALMAGIFTRLSASCGVLLLGLYYLAHPALFGPSAPNAEGSYLIVNKNIVELLALAFIAVAPRGWGLDRFVLWIVARWRSARRADSEPADRGEMMDSSLSRRQVIASLAGLPVIGGFTWAVLKKHGYHSHEEKQLNGRIDAVSSPSMKAFSFETLDDLKGKVPSAKLGKLELSRMMLGGNLMNGFAHARDLIYVSKLIKAYHQEGKIFETFRLAEACGINAIITNPILAPMISTYWNRGMGKIKFLAQCKAKTEKELLDTIRYSIDQGACAAYVQGAAADEYVAQGKFDWIASALELIRKNGIPAGIGGHYLKTISACVDQGFKPDFWMKTLHHHDYWSAKAAEEHDNVFCDSPQETIAYMEKLPQPWIAFKVLAAGSIHPKDGFQYAFQHGADFICVGMYDFQVVENSNLVTSVLKSKLDRKRSWCV